VVRIEKLAPTSMRVEFSQGLPLGAFEVSSVVYNAAAETLVAVLDPTPLAASLQLRQIYIRHVRDEAYRLLTLPELVRPVEIVSCAAAPELLMNTERVVEERRRPDTGELIVRGLEPDGVLRITLPSGAAERLQMPPASLGVGAVMSLLGASATGDIVYVIAETNLSITPGSRYGLFEVGVSACSARLVAPLPGGFA